MGDWLITGMKRCGKSSGVKHYVIPSHRRAGRWVGVLDPVGAQDWGADWVTGDPHRFADAMMQGRNCVGIIDEFAAFYRDYKAMQKLEQLFYMGGNYGNLFYAMAQRLMMVPPNVRSQCDHAMIFQQVPAGLQDLAAQFNQPAILQCATFPRFQAMIVEPFEKPRIIRFPKLG